MWISLLPYRTPIEIPEQCKERHYRTHFSSLYRQFGNSLLFRSLAQCTTLAIPNALPNLSGSLAKDVLPIHSCTCAMSCWIELLSYNLASAPAESSV